MDISNRRRREFLVRALAAGSAASLPGLLHGGSISHLEGRVLVNGQSAQRTSVIRPGDTVSTGAASRVVFVVNDDAFVLRENSRLTLRARGTVVSLLRLVSGALLGVFGSTSRVRTISAPVVTAGLRGTGVYTEVRSASETYLCTCYGEVELDALQLQRKEIVTADHHAARLIRLEQGRGNITTAPLENHSDDELIMLESLVGRQPPFLQSG